MVAITLMRLLLLEIFCFAECGFLQVTVYRCLEGGLIAVLQAYIDEDVCEKFGFCCLSDLSVLLFL